MGVKLPIKQADLPAELVAVAADLVGFTGESVDDAAEAVLAARAEARAAKDWPRADAIRDAVQELGLVIEDTTAGSRLKRA